ncbi:fatty acid-binding protein DegV [Streptococcus azizii]|uniref:Fatty acid-binding protein DegV n=1 Tax=Streptococcus azizii TaxID=1579424 RepID=A0AB36JP95_9STRE|nr:MULTISPECIES: DegV family protein [Streptococcus]MBF0775783.1 DegV family protein [Streptococcus sp. 19428wD3_AN2]ONK29190.1 fatty acid-binding protein DegV [Streptococcus azizii]ONK29736.1 fatty acid-binding protein DegV [Streptococcus azizii]ONK30674.1 fatty acid-binding protein DegV [Streptococcus azizii]TFU84074.1 DegV family protein [Streptococcus sp. AN2]
MAKWKIVADSGCDYKELANPAPDTLFEIVPLTVRIENQHFLDDAGLDIDQMMTVMYASSDAAGSACPSPQAYEAAYAGADNVIVLTLTGSLSGSYNSARVAKEMFLEEHPDVNIHLIDTLSAGGEMDLLVGEINRLIASGLDYDGVVSAISEYQKRTKLLFVLAKVNNLVKNGRLSKLVGAVVGLLNIRMVGEASSDGKLELLQKARGHKKSVTTAFDEILKAGYKGGRIVIAHRNNEKFCQQFSDLVRNMYPNALIEALPTSGLCSFYAEENGLLMGYEI